MKLKLTAKTERILYIAAGALTLVLIAVLLILLRSNASSREEATPTPEATATTQPLPEGTIVIGGRSTTADTDTFYLNGVTLADAELSQIASLSNLRTLSLTKCSLRDVGFLRSLPELTTLYLSDNDIYDITPISSLTGLRTLYLDRNPVTDLSSLTALSSLKTLSLKGVNVGAGDLQALRAALVGCSIFDDGAVDAVRTLSLGGLTFTVEDTSLDLSGRGISDISKLAECKKLEVLNLAGNPLSGLGVLPELSQLRQLDLSNTTLQDSALHVLMGMRQLQWLDIRGNGDITAEALEQLKAALGGCEILHDEVFSRIKLGEHSFMSNVTELLLPQSDLSTLSGLEKCEKLENADFSDNRIVSLRPLRNSVHLRTLNLEKNRITTPEGLFPLSELEWLDLSDNYISDITALSGCTSLRWLDLSRNQLTYISHLALCTQLQWLDLRENPMVTREMVDYLRKYLPNCEILTDLPEETPVPTPSTDPLPPPGNEQLPTTPDATPLPESTPVPEPTPEPTPVVAEGGDGTIPLF